jgi:uncharacterized cofD-like protein
MSKHIVIIGGGTGTVAVLSGLKKYSNFDLSVIVSMTDDGGSNAVIRDEFGLLPLSDLRKSIIALAETDNKILRELFTYRFSKGNGLSGHTLGNLMMMALSDIVGSELEAVKTISRLFKVRGQVIPVTLQTTELVAEYQSGLKVHSEHLIDEPETFDPDDKIIRLHVEPSVPATSEALRSLVSADVIVAGPGDLYTTTLANIVIDGIPQAIQKSHGKFIFITNLMTKRGQTHWMSISDQINEITSYVGRQPDVVVVHSDGLDPFIVQKYAEQNERPMIDDLGSDTSFKVVRADVVNHSEVVPQAGDTLARSLIRHDADKLGEVLRKIVES